MFKILKVLTGCDLKKLLGRDDNCRILLPDSFPTWLSICASDLHVLIQCKTERSWRRALAAALIVICYSIRANTFHEPDLYKYFLQDFISRFRNDASGRRNREHALVGTAVLVFIFQQVIWFSASLSIREKSRTDIVVYICITLLSDRVPVSVVHLHPAKLALTQTASTYSQCIIS